MDKELKIPLLIIFWIVAIILILFGVAFIYGMIIGLVS